jgi:plastocyanin
MKLSTSMTALLLAVVPLAMASYEPVVRRNGGGSLGLVARKDDDNDGKDSKNNNNNNDSKNKDSKNDNNNNNNNNAPAVIIDNSNGDAISGISIVGQGNGQVVVIWVNNGAGQPTQTVNPQVTVTQTVTAAPDGSTVTATAPLAAAATHEITVGGAAGLVYSPDQIQANVGDMVIFKFQSQNHTVTQSTFAEPCVPMEGGMKSGFVPNPNNTITPEPMVAMQVMTTDPIWMYCAQGNHCGSGMVLSINPTLEKTQAQFQAAAIAKFGTGDQSPITGGTPSAAPPATDPTASSAPAPEASGTVPAGGATGTQSVAIGTGTVLPDGSCQCVAVCGTDSFPAAAGSFGGIAGGLPANMLVIGR